MRTQLLGEFQAHEGAVNCVKIGRSTAGVLATGGEDRKINLWRTGQKEVVKSLVGLLSSVECVVFGQNEDTIAAGGASGTIRTWDLESGKVSRSLTGHRAHCLSLAYTNEPNLLVSGSLDCNAKVWDLRRKDAIVTFKGHNKGISKLAISPDNKWVCTGSADGELKLWDIESGRLVKDGWRHNGRITGLEFNQVEFLLVSSGADRTVRVWDLEAWQEVECLGPEATAVQGISYSQDGSVLLTATSDALKVWSVEPAVHHDTVPLDWRNLADLHMYNTKDGTPRALGCCRSGSSVGVFMVDLRKVAPFCTPAQAAAAAAAALSVGTGGAQLQQVQPSSSNSRLTAPIVQEFSGLAQLNHQQQHGRFDMGPDRDRGGTAALKALLGDAAAKGPAEAEAGPLTRQLPRQRTPPQSIAALTNSSSTNGRQAGSAVPTPPAAIRRASQVQQSPAKSSPQQQQQQQQQQQSKGSDYFPEFEIRVPSRPPPAAEQPAPSMQPASRVQQRSAPFSGSASAVSPGRVQLSASNSRADSGLGSDAASIVQLAAGIAAASLQEPPRQQQQRPDVSRSSSSRAQEPAEGLSATLASWLREQPDTAREASNAVSNSSSRSSSVPASRMPSRQNMAALQPQQQEQQQPAAAADPILAAMSAKPGLKLELSRMMSGLQVAKGFVSRGNLEGAYKSVLNQGDPALACMLLEAISSRADAFEVNSLEPLIKLTELLLGSGQEQQANVGLNVLQLVLKGPGQVVHDVCNAPQPPGVDLSFETRRSKCQLLKMALEGLGLKLGVLSRSKGQLGARAQMLAEELRRVVSVG